MEDRSLPESILAVPKPKRSPVDVFSLVEKNLRNTPSPVLRYSSPYLAGGTSSAINLEQGNKDISKDSTFDISCGLSEYIAEPYLGEQRSVHAGGRTRTQSQDFDKTARENMGFFRMSRAHSLEGLATVASESPCMITMPKSRAFSELGDSFETLPPKSWVLPYVIACCPPVILQQLHYLPPLFKFCQASEARIDVKTNEDLCTDLAHNLQDSRPRLVSDTDISLRSIDPCKIQHPSFYQHKSFSSRPPFSSFQSRLPSPPPHNGSDTGRQFCSLVGEVISMNTSPGPDSLSMPGFPPSWRSLGVLLLCKDPTWCQWEPKQIFLLDNYLLESTVDSSRIIGYAQLCGAKIQRCQLTNSSAKLNMQKPVNLQVEKDIDRNYLANSFFSFGLLVTCFKTSDVHGAQVQFWLTTTEGSSSLDIIQSVLIRASRLRVEDVFDIEEMDKDNSLLGRGRFNEVRLAKRRNYRLFDKKILDRLKSDMNCKVPNLIAEKADTKLSSQNNLLPNYKQSSSTIESATASFDGLFLEENDTELQVSAIDQKRTDGRLVDECFVLEDGALFDVCDRIEDDVEMYECSPQKASEPCALKLVSKEYFWERVSSGKERADALVREVLSQLVLESHHLLGLPKVHSNHGQLPFVQIFSVFETANGFALELELMESMDLFDRLAKSGAMPESNVRRIIAQIVEAVSLCNKLGICHRDIKLSNITFPKSSLKMNENASENEIIKLADFGMAGFVGRDKKLRGRCGTPGYVAPDILLAGVDEPYDINIDMFSVGVVAYTLLCGYEPFYGEDNHELMRANRLVEYEFHSPEWDSISAEAKDWIKKALTVSADIRINPEDAKRHPWLCDIFGGMPRQSWLLSTATSGAILEDQQCRLS